MDYKFQKEKFDDVIVEINTVTKLFSIDEWLDYDYEEMKNSYVLLLNYLKEKKVERILSHFIINELH
jgi:hypothetical protein